MSILRKINTYKRLLLLILLIAVFLRALGVYPGYRIQHPDEQSILSQIHNVIINYNLEPLDYYYGLLLGYLYSLIHVIIFFQVPSLSSLIGINNFIKINEFTAYFSIKNNLHYWPRYETAILSSLVIIPIYLLGKRFFNREVGIIAAFLTAVNYRHVLSSTLVLADAPAALFATLSIFLSTSILKKRLLRNYIYASIGIALSLSVKYFIYILPAFIICHILSIWSIPKKSILNRIVKIFLDKDLLIAVLIATTMFILINPYLILKYSIVLKQFAWNASNYHMSPDVISFFGKNSSIYSFYYLWNYGLGNLLSIVVIIGIFYGIIRYTKFSLILLSAIIPFFYVFVVLSGNFGAVHNLSSILPIVLIFPALAIYRLSKIIKIKKFIPVSLIILTVIVGFSSLKNSFLSSLYYSQPRNEDNLSIWIESNIPKNSKIQWVDPVREKHMTIQELKDLKTDYAVITSGFNLFFNDRPTKENYVIGKVFFDNNSFWKMMNNFYASLITKELEDYRIKTFTKPYWQSTENAFSVIKVPTFWTAYEDKLINEYNFTTDNNAWTLKSFFSDDIKDYKVSETQGYDGKNGIKLTSEKCQTQTQILTGIFVVEGEKWYTVSGWIKHEGIFVENVKDGFLRLDFYSSDDRIVKTYVSNQLTRNNWIKLQASGIAPDNSQYANVSLQIDNCFRKQAYIFNKIDVFSSDKKIKINKSEYPYYGVELPKNFFWSPSKFL